MLKQPDPKFSGTDPVVPSATDAEITPISDTETEQLTEDQKQDVDALNNSSNTSEIITENKKSDAEHADTETPMCEPGEWNIYSTNERFLSC